MYSTANKKMLNMLILDILREYSDEEHHLTQQEIIRILKATYGMECDRRSVKNNVEYLIELGYEISTENGYWLMHREFENAELQLLVDCIQFSKILSKRQTEVLIEKICLLGSKYFRETVRQTSHVSDISYLNNRYMLYTLDVLNEAIEKKKKISALYHSYKADGEKHPKRNKPTIWNPYQIVISNGKYYLIGNMNNSDKITPVRMDKLTNVEILDETVKPKEQFEELKNGINFSYLKGNEHMFKGPQTHVKLLTYEWMLDEIVDWIGTDFRARNTDEEGQVEVSFSVNDMALFFWALQYGPCIEIIEPASMREELAEVAKSIHKKYSGGEIEDCN